MKKTILTLASLGVVGLCNAQSAIDAYRLTQPDLKGTARFMGMAGAFGALGGDLSTLSQNPAGIGVYRSSDVGFTLDLDCQHSTTSSFGMSYGMDQTKFLLNNIGAVFTLRLPSSTCPNFNIGFTYNKGVSFNRIYGGNIGRLQTSMSNYIAGIANDPDGSGLALSESELSWGNGYDPYNPGYGNYSPPWITILGYDSYLINPDINPNDGSYHWYGLWDNFTDGTSTTGTGTFLMNEKGAVNEYNIALGGNISNVVYWGMNFDIVNLNYSLSAIWGEGLTNALVPDAQNNLIRESADWTMNNSYSVSGTGFNYQLGLIVKPVQELRLGFAFHTPTWYNLTESFGATVNYLYGGSESGYATTNDGYAGYNNFGLRTPWKIIASAAGVIGDKLIVSFDYEWAAYNKTRFTEPSTFYDDYYYDYDWWSYGGASALPYSVSAASEFINPNDPYYWENHDISTYYKSSNTFRVGAEFKPINNLSVRAGYCYVSSPVKGEVKNNLETVYTSGTLPSYRLDNSTSYVTCGLGYRYSRFYVDLAYVYKHMSSTYHAFTPDPGSNISSPESSVSLNNSQIVLSAGFRF